jgi:hypothetical protein
MFKSTGSANMQYLPLIPCRSIACLAFVMRFCTLGNAQQIFWCQQVNPSINSFKNWWILDNFPYRVRTLNKCQKLWVHSTSPFHRVKNQNRVAWPSNRDSCPGKATCSLYGNNVILIAFGFERVGINPLLFRLLLLPFLRRIQPDQSLFQSSQLIHIIGLRI